MNDIFYELWSDETIEPPYVLLLLMNKNGLVTIHDPAGGNKIIYQSHSYEEAMYWLTEDEYTRVDGRMSLE